MRVLGPAVVFLAAACSPAVSPSDQPSDPCTAGATRCQGDAFQICDNGTWHTSQTCSGAQPVCSAQLGGCAACDPAFPHVCQAGDSHTCNADGSIGPVAQACGANGCSEGECNSDGCATAGVKLIYVVDDKDNLLSFDPGMNNQFKLIGRLSCPGAGQPYPGINAPGDPFAHPFSMAVDRAGTAWILYGSGDLYKASTQDASCHSTNYQPGQSGYELYGMGYVSFAAGSNQEKLYIAGGLHDELDTRGNLGVLDTSAFGITTIGRHDNGRNSPELTGTGDAKLYAYFPGDKVALVDQTTAHNSTSWPVSGNTSVSAWAFAQWGGKFYLFVSEGSLASYNRVYTLDATNGKVTRILDDTDYAVVGAGVSTCAPVSVGRPVTP